MERNKQHDSEKMKMEEKRTINAVFIGHANVGKSTIFGHLIRECGGTDNASIEKCENDAEEKGEGSMKYTWLLDQSAAERERGTMISGNLRRLESTKYHINLIDTPGHCDFIENTTTRISQADVALLCIDSSTSGYGRGMDENGQTRQHPLLAYALGVKQMIVIVNKMDDDSVNFSEDRWKIIRTEVSNYLRIVGYRPMKIPFIPISGWLGDNLISKSIYMPWYDGPTLLEALEDVNVPNRFSTKPLRVPIQDIQNAGASGTVLIGRVETGELRPEMDVQFAPSGIIGTVQSLEVECREVSEAIGGDIVTINMQDKSKLSKHLCRGHILSDSSNHPAQGVSSFQAQLIIMKNYQGEISIGYTPIIDVHTSHTPCKFVDIKTKMNSRTGQVVEKNPRSLKAGDACIAELQPQTPLCVEEFKKFPPLGRFLVRGDSGQTVAFGVVKSVIY